MQRLILTALAVAALASSAAPAARAAGPAPAAFTAFDRGQAIERLAGLLESQYVVPETGRQYAARLRAQLAAGAYDGIVDRDAFAAQVTADLQGVAADKHLRVRPGAPPQGAPAVAQDNAAPSGVDELRMIGEVAYLRFSELPQDPAAAAPVRAFLLAHASAKAVIIDARTLRGGGQPAMDAMLPLFYAAPTTLVRMETRITAANSAGFEFGPTLLRQPSPGDIVRQDHRITPDSATSRLQQTPVYYLTSARTASAGEHLALALKRTHRATLIGETTAGAGHFGFFQTLPGDFTVFLPVGRTYDPDTGFDWEGRGIAPDVAIPADQALQAALARIG